jgi:hypothetical protein
MKKRDSTVNEHAPRGCIPCFHCYRGCTSNAWLHEVELCKIKLRDGCFPIVHLQAQCFVITWPLDICVLSFTLPYPRHLHNAAHHCCAHSAGVWNFNQTRSLVLRRTDCADRGAARGKMFSHMARLMELSHSDSSGFLSMFTHSFYPLRIRIMNGNFDGCANPIPSRATCALLNGKCMMRRRESNPP